MSQMHVVNVMVNSEKRKIKQITKERNSEPNQTCGCPGMGQPTSPFLKGQLQHPWKTARILVFFPDGITPSMNSLYPSQI